MDKLHIYIRVSSASQVEDGSSLEGQARKGKDKAKELGLEPIIHEDAGISASNEALEVRPALNELINKAKKGEIKNIWVFDMTRLSRNLISKAKIVTILKENKVKLYDGNTAYDFDDKNNVLLYNIVGAVTEYDAELRKGRFQIGALTRRRQGAFLGPITPYGYKKDKNKMLVIVEDEAKNIRTMVDLYLNKQYGSGQIANWLNDHKINTKNTKASRLKAGQSNRKLTTYKVNNLWNPGTILSIFKNTVIKGELTFKGDNGVAEFAECPSIISKKEWERIQFRMKQNRIVQKRVDKYMYMLKGLMVCGCCGSNMNGRIKLSRGEFTYRCASKRSDYKKENVCKARGINIFKLNDIVWYAFSGQGKFITAVKNNLDNSQAIEELKKLHNELSIAMDQVHKTEGFKKNLRKLLTRKLMEEKEYIEDRQQFDKELNVLENRISDLEIKIEFLSERTGKKKSLTRQLIAMVSNSSKLKEKYDNLTKEDFLNANHPILVMIREMLYEYIDLVVVTWNPDLKVHVIDIKFKVGDTITDYTDIGKKKINFILNENKQNTSIREVIINHPESQSQVTNCVMWRPKRANTNQRSFLT